jgi:hypothetical protein
VGGFAVPFIRELIGAVAVIWISLLVVVPLSFAIPYAILRMRDTRSEKPDPQVGLKSAMYFFFSLGIMLFLFGLTMLVVDLIARDRPELPPGMRRDEGLNETQRVSLALMVAGLIFTLLHLGLVKAMTNDRNPASRRMFAGWRSVIHGLVILVVVTVLLVIYFQKDFGGEGTLRVRKQLWATLLVWTPSWILHLVLLWFYSRPLYEPSRTLDRPDRPEWQR